MSEQDHNAEEERVRQGEVTRDRYSTDRDEAVRILHQLSVLTATSGDYLEAQEVSSDSKTIVAGFGDYAQVSYDGYPLPDAVNLDFNHQTPSEFVRNLKKLQSLAPKKKAA